VSFFNHPRFSPFLAQKFPSPEAISISHYFFFNALTPCQNKIYLLYLLYQCLSQKQSQNHKIINKNLSKIVNKPKNLEEPIKLALELLKKFKQQDDFAEKVKLAFSESADVEGVVDVIDDWSEVQNLPAIEVLSPTGTSSYSQVTERSRSDLGMTEVPSTALSDLGMTEVPSTALSDLGMTEVPSTALSDLGMTEVTSTALSDQKINDQKINGAYAGENNTIYLAEEFLRENINNPIAVTEVIIEELGHALDWKLHPEDAEGDEGAIFAALVTGETPDEQIFPPFNKGGLGGVKTIAQLKAENDQTTLVIDGEVWEVELATPIYNPAFDLIDLYELRDDPAFADIDGFANGNKLTVAVIDTGLDKNQPLLADNFLLGVNLFSNENDFDDVDGHGTHVAGIIAANDENVGVAPEAGIVAVKVYNNRGGGESDRIMEGLRWVRDNYETYNIIAVNISLGIESPGSSGFYQNISEVSDDQKEAIALIEELENAGITVISAGGNGYYPQNKEGWAAPAIYSTLAVGAVWQDGINSDVSLYGTWVEETTEADKIAIFSQRLDNDNSIFAPGAYITSTSNDWENSDDYKRELGTSQAAPHVTGAVVLMQDAALTFGGRLLTPDEIRDIIRDTADPISDGNKYYKRLNINQAVQEVKERVNNMSQSKLWGSSFDVITDSLATGTTSQVKVEVTNSGDTDANPFIIKVYLSENPWMSTGDREIASINFPSVGAQDDEERTIDINIPSSIDNFWNKQPDNPDNNYYIGMVLYRENRVSDDENDYKYDQVEGYYYEPVQIIGLGLVSTYLGLVEQENISANTDFDVKFDILNNSSSSFEEVEAEFYLSDDTNISSEEDQLLDTYEIGLINSLQTETLTYTLNIQDDLLSEIKNQQAVIGIKINDKKSTGQASTILNPNEGKDFIRVTINNSAPPPPVIYPDLLGIYFNVLPDPLNAGDSFTIEYKIANILAANAGGFKVKFYFSKNDVIWNSDELLGSDTISGITGNNVTETRTINLTLPDANDSFWQGDGEYYIGMIIDADNEVDETDENNNFNRGIAVDIQLSSQEEIDLFGVFFDVINEPLNAGDSFDVEFGVQNTEAGNAGEFQVEFYLSDNASIWVSDRLLGTYTVESLPGNADTGKLITNLTLPGIEDEIWLGDGKYYIGMIIDRNNSIMEFDEQNNVNQGMWVDFEDVDVFL